MTMIGFDTETTGVDLYLGAQPFLVTFCDEQWNNTYFEWDVNPFTREVKIPAGDLEEIRNIIEGADWIVAQNVKFDVTALATIMPDFEWPWHKTYDTLVAGHLLASNHPKDLTSMAVEYLGVSIQKYEDALEIAVRECRNLARPLGWRIAKAGLPEMPSAKAETWKYDSWLPRAMSKRKLGERDWLSVTTEYANADSATTLALFIAQRKLLEQRGLWAIYQERLRALPVVYRIERRGVTASLKRIQELEERFGTLSQESQVRCEWIAEAYGYPGLQLPKGAKNKSLSNFMFNVMKLPPIYNAKAKSSEPCLNRDALIEYCDTLPPHSKPLRFIQSLRDKRLADTALSYLAGYQRFWEASGAGYYRLHPNLNFTGTDTLRMSSSNPNEQNISKREGFNLRYGFGPLPGREWWSLDYENLELRIPAYECGEPAMLKLFENPAEPPYYGSYHLLIFSILHPDKYDHNDPEGLVKAKDKYKSTWYQWVKNGNFADMYGAMIKSGTADRAFHVPGAQQLVSDRLQEKTKLNQKWITFAEKHGYVETLPDKSIDPKRGYPLLCTRSQWGKILPTIPLNYHVQGTACWIMMRAMTEVQTYLDDLERSGTDAFITMNVHDEIVLDFPFCANKGNLPLIERIQKIMTRLGDDVGVKLSTNIEYHPKHWADKS